MQIVFRVPHLFTRESVPRLNEDAARAIFECLPALNCGKRIATGRAIASGMLACGPGFILFRPACAFGTKATDKQNAECLAPLLNCLRRINRSFLEEWPAVPLYSMIDAGKVYYRRTVCWDAISQLYRLGYGDCKSLSALACAEKDRKGEESRIVFRFAETGRPAPDNKVFHILVQNPNGWEDPSKMAGMGANEWAHF